MCSAECRPGDEGGAYLHATIFFRIVSLPETEGASEQLTESSPDPPTALVWQVQVDEGARGDDERMMPGAAEVMPEASPVPLLQRRSAAEARWHEPVSTSRDCARKAFGNVRVCPYPKWKEPRALSEPLARVSALAG